VYTITAPLGARSEADGTKSADDIPPEDKREGALLVVWGHSYEM